MDDVQTETEVRRLFAAATETIPPGHDLLDGVRQRQARNRLRARAAIGAGSAAAVAAGALLSVTAAGAPSALAAVTGAAAKTSGDSYRISMTSMTAVTSAYPKHHSAPVQVTGEFDPARQVGEEVTSEGSQYRYIGHYMYWKPTSGYDFPHKPWLRASVGLTWSTVPVFKISQLTVGALGGNTATPQNLLMVLKSASTVRDEGPASGPGWTGTKYSFSGVSPKGSYQTAYGTVYIDRQGQVREMVVTCLFRADIAAEAKIKSTTSDVTFSDFGVRVSVTPPPASQVTDMNVHSPGHAAG
jgi:hypothetical protein